MNGPPRARITVLQVRQTLLVVSLVVALVASCSASGPPAVPPTVAGAWLARYVQPDGRVSRFDQGDDTVSEGQSYALALALADRDTATFDRVWQWTRTHLQQSDGLLAYHADSHGTVLDRTPATDADLVIAWALLRRGGSHATDGQKVAAAVLARETVTVGTNRLLAAGPWATGSPATLNPSYWALPVLRDLAHLTGDHTWDRLADGADRLLATLPDPLPPDWLRADGSVVRAEPSPDGSRPTQYGPDAQRLPLWSAWACSAADRAAGQRAKGRAGGTLSSDLRGRPLQTPVTPLAQLLADPDAAAVTARRFPTYYGDAWVALEGVHTRLLPW